MIPVSLSYLIVLPLTTNLLLILLFWAYYSVRERVRAPATTNARIYRCSVCEHVYVDARDVPLARCTRCGCLNEAVKR